MSEDTPAVSLELDADEKAQLESLKTKEQEVAKAKAAKEAEEAAAKQEDERREIAERPLFHVLVRHNQRSARTRSQRAARSGHRRQGALMDDGTRIRRKGKGRYTEMDLRELVNNHERLLEYVRVGTLEVCDPKTESVIPYDDLVKMIVHVAEWLKDHKAHQAHKNYLKEMGDYESAMKKHEAELAVWQEALDAFEAGKKKHLKALAELKDGEEPPVYSAKPPPPRPAEPVMPEEPEGPGEVMGITDPAETQDALPSAAHGGAPGPGATRPDLGEGELLAKLDQHEAEMTGEAAVEETSEAEEEAEEESLSEEDLKKMTRPQLNETAALFEIEAPESYPNKDALIEAIFALQNEKE